MKCGIGRDLQCCFLAGNDKKVYDFVCRSFLACCSKDATGTESTVEIDIAGEKFAAKG